MTTASLADLRSRLCKTSTSEHAGHGGEEPTASVFRREIGPLLPWPAAGPVVDRGCGRGELVWLLQADGFNSIHARSSQSVAHGLSSARA